MASTRHPLVARGQYKPSPSSTTSHTSAMASTQHRLVARGLYNAWYPRARGGSNAGSGGRIKRNTAHRQYKVYSRCGESQLIPHLEALPHVGAQPVADGHAHTVFGVRLACQHASTRWA
eukprot:1384844-Rhodomonas_salina.1